MVVESPFDGLPDFFVDGIREPPAHQSLAGKFARQSLHVFHSYQFHVFLSHAPRIIRDNGQLYHTRFWEIIETAVLEQRTVRIPLETDGEKKACCGFQRIRRHRILYSTSAKSAAIFSTALSLSKSSDAT